MSKTFDFYISFRFPTMDQDKPILENLVVISYFISLVWKFRVYTKNFPQIQRQLQVKKEKEARKRKSTVLHTWILSFTVRFFFISLACALLN